MYANLTRTELLRSGVYSIRCNQSDRVYVGQASNIYTRWVGHRSDLRLNKNKNVLLQRTYNKYGLNNLEFSVLEFCEVQDLDSREAFWIKQFSKTMNFYQEGNDRARSRIKPVSESHKLKVAIANSIPLTALGRTQTYREWSDETGLAINTIRCRVIYRGWCPDKAVTTPSLIPRKKI